MQDSFKPPHQPSLNVRRFRSGDEPALFAVHRSAIERIASRDYTPEQIRAWLPEDEQLEAWAQKVRVLTPFVACNGEEIVGYADLQADGLIDHFYVSGHHSSASSAVGASRWWNAACRCGAASHCRTR